MLDNIGAPTWVMQTILLVLALGLPLVIIVSWAYEVTTEGIKRETQVERSSSITHQTGRKLDRVIIVLLVIAAGYFFWESRYSEDSPGSESLVTEQTASSTPTEVVSAADPQAESATEADSHSIAVLPFDNRSNLEEDEFFVEGIHDDLLTNLAKISSLKVISRTSVSRYKDTQIPIPEIAKELGVATIMEGAVQRAGNTVRINVQLIDAKTDEHLWAEIFDRELTTENLFAIQSEISQKIAQALKATLSVEEKQRVNEQPTDNLAAYSAYQRGRQLMSRRTAETIDKALLEFQRAVELDPNFALAWVGVSESAFLALEFSDMKRPETFRLAGEASEKALAINDQLGEAYLARAELFSYQRGSEADAESAYKLAIELSPGYALAWQWYARTLSKFPDRLGEALELSQRAAELDPLSLSTQNQVISVLVGLGRYEQAQERLVRLIEQDPGFASSYERMSNLKGSQRLYGEEIYWLHKAQALDPGNISYRLLEMWPTLRIGNIDDVTKLVDHMAVMDPNSSTLSYMETWANIYKGNYDAALEAARIFHQTRGSHPRARRLEFVVQNFREDYPGARAASEAALPEFYLQSSWQKGLEGGPVNGCLVAWVMTHTNDEEMGQELAREAIAYVNSASLETGKPEDPEMGLCYMVLGRPDDTLTIIEEADKLEQIPFWWLAKGHPAYKLLKHEPRFQAADAEIQELAATQRESLRRLEAEEGF